MTKLSTALPFAAGALEAGAGVPLYRQLYDDIRRAILAGQLKAGTRLPSTRELASDLRVSRNTVMNAFEQLLSEGYVEGHIGSGTFVSRILPDELLNARAGTRRARGTRTERRALSSRGALLAATPVNASRFEGRARPFRPGTPALDSFPFETWARLTAKHWRRPRRDLLNYGDPGGHARLRAAIAAYLGTARAVRCEPEQVIVVAGAQQALDLAARVLLDPGDAAWVEEPGYLGAKGALRGAGARLVPVPLDEQGMNIEAGAKSEPSARLAYVSPSHQYPSGVTMSLPRRLALIEWASRAGAWILEDDYDSEYRYAGRPLAALQGLDTEGRVIYIGTFSKVLFPALRIGYMVVPADLAGAFCAARALSDRHSPTVEQLVLADFIEEGHFARHVRRMRALYAARQEVLVEAARRELRGLLEVETAAAGLHVLGWLPEGTDDREAARAAEAHGVDAQPLSAFCLLPPKRSGLVLGYAGYDAEEIRAGVKRLAEALRSCARPRSSKRSASAGAGEAGRASGGPVRR
ncbi:MAG TPA: PLP-dependent aminotransferase family protein [Pyrinomonadaceae bacterium]|nr:PLP-dependent aminotransferase family protein [Pyrinomonadaceae bacterium]